MNAFLPEQQSPPVSYADDLAIQANTAADISLHVNAHKTEYMCYNQTGDLYTLDGTPLKLEDIFTYLGSSVSSPKKQIDTRLTKAWTASNSLSIIWKSDLTDKMKRSFFQAAVVSILLYGCITWMQTKRLDCGSLTVQLFSIICRTLVVGELLPLFIDSVGVFYNLSCLDFSFWFREVWENICHVSMCIDACTFLGWIDNFSRSGHHIYIHIYIYIYIYIYIKLAPVVEGNPKAPFSIATIPISL